MKVSLFYYHSFFVITIIFICIFSFSFLLKSLANQSNNFVIHNDIILSDSSFNTSNSQFVWPTPGYNYITSHFGYRNAPTSGARFVSFWH